MDVHCDDLRNIILDCRHEIERADAKAEILLAMLGVALGALVAGLLGSSWSPTQIGDPARWIWWLGSIALFVAGGLLIAAVYPRLPSVSVGAGASAYTFAAIAQLKRAEELLAKISLDESARNLQLAQVSISLAQIALRKHQLVRLALMFLALGVILMLLCAVLA